MNELERLISRWHDMENRLICEIDHLLTPPDARELAEAQLRQLQMCITDAICLSYGGYYND